MPAGQVILRSVTLALKSNHANEVPNNVIGVAKTGG